MLKQTFKASKIRTGILSTSSKMNMASEHLVTINKLTSCFHELFTYESTKNYHQYFSVQKKIQIPVQKGHFFLSFEQIITNITQYLVGKFVDSYSENSWKQVVSLTIAQNPISEILLIFTNFSFVMEMNCWNINVDMITFDSPSNTEYIY